MNSQQQTTHSQLLQHETIKKAQTKQVVYLALCFLLLMTSYSSLQNIISLLYEQLGYKNLGQSAVLCVYLACALFTPFTSYIVKKIGYTKSMLICSFGYFIFSSSGLLIVQQIDLYQIYIWLIICSSALICGVSCSIIWVAQGGYISYIAKQKKKQYISLFWIIMLMSIFFASCLTTFVLGNLNDKIYFYILLGILGCSSLMFSRLFNVKILNEINNNSSLGYQKHQKISIQKSITNLLSLIWNKKNIFICVYFLLSGMTIAFYSGFLYKIIRNSLPKQQDQQQEEYQKRLKLSQGFVFICLGLSELVLGHLKRKIFQSVNEFKMIFITAVIALSAGITSLICYYTKQYFLIFFAAILWGTTQIFTQTNSNIIVTILFKGSVQGFSLLRICFSFGICSMLGLNILLSKQNPEVYIGVVVGLQIVSLGVSFLLWKKHGQQKQNCLQQSLESTILSDDNIIYSSYSNKS